jgi:hypothetical protein
VALCLVLLWGLSGTASAQAGAAGAGEAQGYGDLIDLALDELQRGNWDEAEAYFRRAHALQPNARTLHGLGVTSFEGRRYVAAIDFFEAALADARKPLTERQRETARAGLSRSKTVIARLSLQLSPRDATVRVDGNPARIREGGELWLDPGTHEIVFTAPGHDQVVRRLRAKSGTTTELAVALEPVGGAPVASAAPPGATAGADEDVTAGSDGPGALPWVAVGVGGALAAGGAVMLVMGLDDIDSVEHAEPGTFYDEIEDAEQRGPVLVGAGAAMLGLGVAGAVLGVVWLGDTESADASTARLGIGPGRVLLRGSF